MNYWLDYTGLKKVSNDMKTHKNPELRASSVVKATDIKPKTSTTTKAAVQTKKPPVMELRGQKWMVVRLLHVHVICQTFDRYMYSC